MGSSSCSCLEGFTTLFARELFQPSVADCFVLNELIFALKLAITKLAFVLPLVWLVHFNVLIVVAANKILSTNWTRPFLEVSSLFKMGLYMHSEVRSRRQEFTTIFTRDFIVQTTSK